MLSYPSSISLSTRSLNHLADLIRARRKELRSRWRRLTTSRQALLALAHLRNGDTPAQLAAGFEIGSTTAWRYIREAVDLLATTAPTLAQAMTSIARLAYAILDGTLVRTDRLGGTANRRYYAGKPRHHAVNIQVIADCAGRLKWVSPALPGSTHDLTAAREHGIIDALAEMNVMTFADKTSDGRNCQAPPTNPSRASGNAAPRPTQTCSNSTATSSPGESPTRSAIPHSLGAWGLQRDRDQ
ncbi:transposase family protein [Virgisporangium aurantiacum]|uniref:DDE superfamily endonuclease n=1 Tax=Virgisporangium aurantiacum TaxID=175570 RepID=A0A8J4E1M3_9ACTN|nr:transposase family protein [Virgisporangium aurantiacum]GIJ58945.1 hypothetical protein Vau01_064610 [Virgisporangium aurantiacum]